MQIIAEHRPHYPLPPSIHPGATLNPSPPVILQEPVVHPTPHDIYMVRETQIDIYDYIKEIHVYIFQLLDFVSYLIFYFKLQIYLLLQCHLCTKFWYCKCVFDQCCVDS